MLGTAFSTRDEFLMNKLRLEAKQRKPIIAEMLERAGRRNHGCTTVGNTVYSVLGRWAESVETMHLSISDGKPKQRLVECEQSEFCNLNHVAAVTVKDASNTSIWIPCGFEGHEVGNEMATRFARIVNPRNLEVHVGPALEARSASGACAALALRFGKRQKEDVCAFGGTDGSHDTGTFLKNVRCYDRESMRWWRPFDELPFGLDHANAVHVEAGVCHHRDPARVLLMNYRTDHYANMRTEVLASDLRAAAGHKSKASRTWYVYSNDTTSLPRDASGTIVIAKGRYIIQFGGVFYAYASTREASADAHELLKELASMIGGTSSGPRRSQRRGYHVRFDLGEIRVFDTCARRWLHVDRMKHAVFATQTCRTRDFAYTCGGKAGGSTKADGGDSQNTRTCDIRSVLELEVLIQNAITRSALRTRASRARGVRTKSTPGHDLTLELLRQRTPFAPERKLRDVREDASRIQRDILHNYGTNACCQT